MTDFDVLMQRHRKLQDQFYELMNELKKKMVEFKAFIHDAGKAVKEAKKMPASLDFIGNRQVVNSGTIFIKNGKIPVM